MFRLTLGLAALAAVFAVAATAGAQTAFTAPETAIGATSLPQTATLTFTAAGTLGSTSVLTQGAPGLDFKLVPGGSCTVGTPYNVGDSCSVLYSFAPAAPGRRIGGVLLYDNSASPVVLATSFLTGIGDGPLATISAGIVTYPITGLDNPQGVAFDGAGNYYVGGGGSNTVLKYSPQGVLLATLGSGFNYPTGVAVDGVGNVYVANEENHQIILLPVGGGPQTVVADGLGYPYPLVVDGAGNIYTGQLGNGYTTAGVIQISPTGVVTPMAYEVLPVGLALDSSGNIFASDYFSGSIKRIPAGGGTATPLNVGVPTYNPYGLAIDAAGNLYIGEYSSETSGQLLEVPSTGGTAVTLLSIAAQTNCLTLGPTGNLYFCDKPNNRIGMLDRSSGALTFASTPLGASSAQQVVTLENDGNTTLAIGAPSITGPFNLGGAGTTCGSMPAAGVLSAETGCGLGVVFAPTAEGPATGSISITDNTLNAPDTVQTIALTGTGGPKAINFPQPATPVLVGTMATLTATVSNGDPVTYSIVSGTASLSGAQITYTTVGGVTIEADSAANGSASAAAPVQRTVQVQTQSTISWTPSSTTGYAGTALGAGVLDASASAPGSFAYTATNSSNITTAIDATSGLPAGAYTLTANFTPSDPDYATASATISFTVLHQEVFVANSTGSVASFYEGGAAESGATPGGGIGAAVDANGYVWSIDASGSSVTQFTDAGAVAARYSGAGIGGASALAIDGNGVVWIANSNSISALTGAGMAVSATPVAQAGNISAPGSITVDTAGSLWLANTGNNTVTEVIGVAAPVAAPTVTQVIQSAPATKP